MGKGLGLRFSAQFWNVAFKVLGLALQQASVARFGGAYMRAWVERARRFERVRLPTGGGGFKLSTSKWNQANPN